MAANAAARTDAGRVRETNEDRWLVREERGVTLLAVADGVGGEDAGELASAAAVDALERRFFGALSGGSTREALGAALREANDAVLGVASGRGTRSASTLVAAAIRRGEVLVANLGDSRAYVVRDGAARQLTTDHAGPRSAQITRFVGDENGVQPDVFVEPLRGGDRVLLCSDGLTRHVSDAEIASRAGRAEPARAAEDLVALANERGGEDNVTVVVYRAPGTVVSRATLATLLLILLVTVGVVAAALAALSRAP